MKSQIIYFCEESIQKLQANVQKTYDGLRSSVRDRGEVYLCRLGLVILLISPL